jgi:hypothetical protein
MISFEQYVNQNLLLEMVVHQDNEGDGKFVYYKGNIWVFDEDEASAETAMHISTICELKNTTKDISDVLSQIEYREDILDGEVRDEILHPNSSKTLFGEHAEILKKIQKALNLWGIEWGQDYETEYLQEHYYYHGTCVAHLKRILRFGLVPREKHGQFTPSNFSKQGIEHLDRVFVTSNIGDALFHASNSADINESSPVVLTLKIPDPTKLRIDYDDYHEFGATTHHEPIYNQTKTPKDALKHIPNKPWKQTGRAAYVGRVPMSHIFEIRLWPEFPPGEKIKYFSDENWDDGVLFYGDRVKELPEIIDFWEETGVFAYSEWDIENYRNELNYEED